MQIRFQADADLDLVIVRTVIRREPAVDFQTATVADLTEQPDMNVLALAAQEGRILVTHDHKTMPRHFARFIANATSSGVIIVPQHVSTAIAADELLLIWSASDADEWRNRISYIPL